jgi:hypothetical protein
MAWVTPLPSQRVLSPSRFSTASCAPVDAPEGTAARPKLPSSSDHIDFDRRVATAVEDLARMDVDDRGHEMVPLPIGIG